MRKLHLAVAASVTALALSAFSACGSDDNGDDDNNNNNATTYSLTLTAGSNGTVAAAPTGTTFDAGTDVTVTATPNGGFKVASWTGTNDDASTSPVNHVTMSANKTVNVTFTAVSAQTFTLTLSPGANGSITAAPTGGTYNDGQTVTLTAVPDSGFKLGAWTGTNNDVSTSNSNTVTMTANKTVSATFVVAPVQKTLTLVIDQSGSPGGSWGVMVTPPATTYHAHTQDLHYDVGTELTLSGVDALNWPFLGYSGDIGGENGAQCTIHVTMDVDRTIHASIPLDSDTDSLCP